jgi:hypothetical protein
VPRVLVLNNYPFEDVWEEVNRGEKPDHHLYGVNYFLKRGYEPEIIPFEYSKILQKIGKLLQDNFPIPLGNLDRQWLTLLRLSKADLIYAPCQTESHLLSYLRATGFLDVPIVCVAHHPLNRGKLSLFRHPFVELWVKGTDSFPALSSKLSVKINSISGCASKSIPLVWGPDANYYPSTSNVGCGVVAAGRTGRDFVTFGLAASQTKVAAHIICLESSVTSAFHSFGQNVQITLRPDNSPIKYPELLEIYSQARAIAIPMHADMSLCGLTSLTDALAMGKPVIMTRTPLIDLDIEAEGVGKWVNPGDIEGWSQAIQFFHDHEDEADAMGKRARRLVEAGINSESFANQVMDIFDELIY